MYRPHYPGNEYKDKVDGKFHLVEPSPSRKLTYRYLLWGNYFFKNKHCYYLIVFVFRKISKQKNEKITHTITDAKQKQQH